VPGLTVPRLAAVAAALAGLVLRLALIPSSWGVLDGDEAIMGLMGRAVLDGDFPAFLWGQRYGGATEAYLIAGVFAVLGSATLGLRIVTIALAAVAAVLTWRIGRRLLGPPAGAAAGLLMWLWPAANIFLSLRTRGFYWATIVCGLAFLLAALRLAERPNGRDALLAGLVAGVGWWNTPYIVAFVVPVAVWALVQARHVLRPLATLGVPGAVVGALPWIVVNLREGLVSLETGPQPPELAGGYLDNLHTFATLGLPVALGLKLQWSLEWISGGRLLFALVLVALLGGLAWRRAPLLVWLGLVAFPLVHAASPLSWYVGEGRYLVYFVPFLALAVAAAAGNRLVLPVAVVVLAGLTVHGMHAVGSAPTSAAPDRPIPSDLEPLVDDLERRDIQAVYANYWLAYPLAFESDERILVTPIPPNASRRPQYDERTAAAARVAYVSVAGSVVAATVRAELGKLGVPFAEHEVGGFVVIEPVSPVSPARFPLFGGR
jgi:MFS family permease